MSRSRCVALLSVLASWTTATAQTANGPAAPGGAAAVLGAPIVSGPTLSPPEVQGGGAACALESCVGWEGPGAPTGRFWASGEYLLWWIRDSHLPPLVTAGSLASGGILGQPGTVVLFGGHTDNEERSGGRFRAAYWLDCQQTFGIEGSYFFLGSRSVNFAAGSPGAGSAVISRPFFNVITGAEDAELVSVPGVLTGTVAVNLSSRLQGAELNGVCNLCCGCGGRVDLLAGFRYLELNEGLQIAEDLTVNPSVPLAGGTAFRVNDQFNTRNRFYGGQIGARAEFRSGGLFVNVLGKVALGSTDQAVDVAGSTVIAPPGQVPTVGNGGLLAQPTNSGHFTRDQFTVVPEVGINVGYQVTEHLRAFVGYSFLYWSNVARPGDQIDRAVNPTQLPVSATAPHLIGPARPAPVLRDTDFWAQGISFGVEFRY
jgi:hypothetical protein